MSSYYRYGAFDGNNGATAYDMAQARTDARTESIRRPAVKIDVMSDEEWNRRMEAANKRRQQEEAKIEQELAQKCATAKEAAIRVLNPYLATVKRQREYQPQLAKKLKAYHEKPAGDKTPPNEWKEAYNEVGRLLTAALVSFHFQSDKEHGVVQGPGRVKFHEAGMERDMPETPTLQAYLTHRHVPVSDDEVNYFKSLVERKVDLPIFLVAAAEDNLERISKTEGTSLAAPKALLEFVVEDELIREEVVEIFLEPESS
ncbi:uncharacterized protein B0J16DRAFT_373744 [Fusarium flagelliforme]|uniref:uncharacterized protein n=1 Tax=Fusarium flagelliforme TaxID=2675880 RepID=UPI001E8DABD7|nr:uncharacterized protein B0J16DRAFT_373744 [Fusarium flagelliforme]KAH7183239.1 hypothetical protein B0J16DRAFT_373744 [Fusarium flagelliforme]